MYDGTELVAIAIRTGHGPDLHPSARTTEALCRAIQRSQESIRALARRLRNQPEDRRQVEAEGDNSWRAGGTDRMLPRRLGAFTDADLEGD